MVSRKLPELGMPKWIAFLLPLDSLDGILKTSLKKKFEMTDLGFLHYFLGLQVLQTNEGIFLFQSKYACDLLRRFHMDDCKPTPSPFQSRVNIFATCTSSEVDATLYCQLVGSLLYLTHTRPDLSFVVGLVADPNDQKSTSGYVFSLGSGPITFFSRSRVPSSGKCKSGSPVA